MKVSGMITFLNLIIAPRVWAVTASVGSPSIPYVTTRACGPHNRISPDPPVTVNFVTHIFMRTHNGLTGDTSTAIELCPHVRRRRKILTGSEHKAKLSILYILLSHRATERRAMHADHSYGCCDQ